MTADMKLIEEEEFDFDIPEEYLDIRSEYYIPAGDKCPT